MILRDGRWTRSRRGQVTVTCAFGLIDRSAQDACSMLRCCRTDAGNALLALVRIPPALRDRAALHADDFRAEKSEPSDGYRTFPGWRPAIRGDGPCPAGKAKSSSGQRHVYSLCMGVEPVSAPLYNDRHE